MELSVVISTLNDRERLLASLDALSNRTPDDTEVIVVNGPSSDGTTGAVRERDDVDVLVEISERSSPVSRNAGLEVARGSVVAFLGGEYAVDPTWYDAIESGIRRGAEVITGPVSGGTTPSIDPKRPKTVARRKVTLFDGDNVAFDRAVLEELDGFDEYVSSGDADDCAHRVAGLGFDVTWNAEMSVRSEVGTDGGHSTDGPGNTYRSLAYRLTKNYGPRPTIVARCVGSVIRGGITSARAVASGDGTPTDWAGNGTTVVTNLFVGFRDGIRARYADRATRRNPHGLSARHDRAVQLYDRR